jgi:8-oxo-dGTP pyrophosphatase MutT (NUDIX family)
MELRERLLRRLAPLLWKGQVAAWQLRGGHLLGVKLVLVRGDDVLLVRHTYRSGWFLPGGGLKRGEDLASAARREAREETGAVLADVELLGVFTHRWKRVTNHIAVFAAELPDLPHVRHWEVADLRLFHRDRLPRGIAPGDRRRIAEYFAGERGLSGCW